MTVGPVVMGWMLDLTQNHYPTAFACISIFAIAGMLWSLIAFQKK